MQMRRSCAGILAELLSIQSSNATTRIFVYSRGKFVKFFAFPFSKKSKILRIPPRISKVILVLSYISANGYHLRGKKNESSPLLYSCALGQICECTHVIIFQRNSIRQISNITEQLAK